MNKILTAAAIIALGATAASAADLPARTYSKAPIMAPAPVYDWTGIYFGAQLGAKRSETSFFSLDPLATLGYTVRHTSFAAGGFGGIQRQFGQFVLGLEGGYITGFDNSPDFASPQPSIFFGAGTGTTNAFGLKNTWTVGGRAGFAFNNWLPYITGGYASGEFGFNSFSPITGTFENAKARLDGYYIGGGVDYAVTQNWILGIEYKHYEFQDKTVLTTNPVAFVNNVVIDGKGDTFLARLSYKFGWAGAPIAARY
jgi:outer membrane immunogenic protein